MVKTAAGGEVLRSTGLCVEQDIYFVVSNIDTTSSPYCSDAIRNNKLVCVEDLRGSPLPQTLDSRLHLRKSRFITATGAGLAQYSIEAGVVVPAAILAAVTVQMDK